MTVAVAPQAEMIERVRALAAGLLARDRWSREQLLAHQAERLRGLLRNARAASPYYREALPPDAADRTLSELPTLPKATFVDEWERIVTDRSLRLRDVERHVAGPSAAEAYRGTHRVVTTSGTSGLRGLFVYGPEDWPTWVAVNLRMLARLGVGPETRLTAIGAPDPVHLSKQVFSIFQAGRTGAPRLSVLTPLDEIVDALNAYQPDALLGYPTVAGLLADEQLQGRLHISPTKAGFGSEPLTDDIRARIKAAWGIDAANVYATSEAPIVAAADMRHRDLDISEDVLVVEVVDEHDRPVPPGVAGAKVLVTNLENRVQPLIRYELTDSVTPAAPPNRSGRPYACLAHVDGRTADVLHLPGRAGGTVAILPYCLGGPFAALPAVRQFQIVHEPARIDVRVVLRPGAPPDTAERVRHGLAATLSEAGAVPPPLDVVEVTELEREPGPAAKLKLVCSRV